MPDLMRDTGFNNTATAGPQKPAVGKYYLVAIAIDNYDEAHDDPQKCFEALNNPVLDASRIVKILTERYTFDIDQESINYASKTTTNESKNDILSECTVIEYGSQKPRELSSIKCFYNENATRARIIDYLNVLKQGLNKNDCVLLYIAGHGTPDGYFIPFTPKEKIGNELSTTEFIDLSDISKRHFPDTDSCLDLLIIYDACFSGAAVEGFSYTDSAEYASRYLLASQSADRKVSDGVAGKSSPFANILYRALEENGKTKSYIDNKSLGKAINKTQEIIYKELPGKRGKGEFIFELKEQNKPDTKLITNHLIEYLDFEEQITQIRLEYKLFKNKLNYITTQGTNIDIQKFFCKRIFHYFFAEKHRENSGINYRSGLANHYHLSVNGINKSIWEALQKDLTTSTTESPKEQKDIAEWYFSKLHEGSDKHPGLRHVIIWIGFQFGSKDVSKEIKEFIHQWKTHYDNFLLAQPLGSESKMGKCFIIFSDERNVNNSLHEELKTLTGVVNDANIIPTSKSGTIKASQIIPWGQTVKNNMDNECLQQLGKRENDPFIRSDGLVDYEYSVEEFLEKFFKLCKYSDKEKGDITLSLYDHIHKILQYND
jgi:hypothetical protein